MQFEKRRPHTIALTSLPVSLQRCRLDHHDKQLFRSYEDINRALRLDLFCEYLPTVGAEILIHHHFQR